jgi:hypothetical protein
MEVLIHDRPMEEDLLDIASIFELNHSDPIQQACRQITKQGIMPTIQKVFNSEPWKYPIQFQLWLEAVRFFVRHKLLELQYIKKDTYLTVTSTDSCVQLTFYPIGAIPPKLHLRQSTGRYFFTYHVPLFLAKAAMVESAYGSNGHSKLKLAKSKDPTIDVLGDPSYLNNYLPDSGATQHMTPRLADLVDVVEGQRLGVEVADGHIIRCSTTGSIRVNMQDDNGK